MIITHQSTTHQIRRIVRVVLNGIAGAFYGLLSHPSSLRRDAYAVKVALLIVITIYIIFQFFTKRFPYKIVYDTEMNLIIIEYYKFFFFKKVLKLNDRKIQYMYYMQPYSLGKNYILIFYDMKSYHIIDVTELDMATNGKAKLDEIVLNFKENGVKEKIVSIKQKGSVSDLAL